MVTKRLIGTDLDQIPRNKDLGVNAYIDSDYAVLTNAYIKNAELTGVASTETYNSNTPVASPTFYCDFAKTKTVDSRVTFIRDSIATYTDADGLIKTVQPFQPRFDHDPITGKCKGVLVEEERTNLIYSANYFNPSGDPDSMTKTLTMCPDGTNSAFKFTINPLADGGNILYITNSYNAVTLTAGKSYTFSVYIKPYNVSYMKFIFQGNYFTDSIQRFAKFDLVNKSVYDIGTQLSNAKIETHANGWLRLMVTVVPEVTTTSYAGIIQVSDEFGVDLLKSSIPDGTVIMDAWGQQMEEGSFATSLIPTTNGSVTRKADVMYLSGTEFTKIYNPNEGTLVGYAYAKNGPPVVSGNRTEQFLSLSDGTNLNRTLITRALNNGVTFNFNGTPSSVNYYNKDYTYNLYVKFAGGFNSTTTNVAYNGSSLGSQGQGSYINLATMNKLSIGSAFDTANGFWNSTIAYVAYYPKKLTEAELQEITYL